MYNAATDVKRVRRQITDEELTALLTHLATPKAPKTWSMTAGDRAILYRVAVGTGFRAAELASLTVSSFDLDNERGPTVAVAAAYSKHRKRDVQPIATDLAALLAPWLTDKDDEAPVFNLTEKTSRMIREDMRRARAAWIRATPDRKQRRERNKTTFMAYRDSAGRVADFHSLRHTYISRIISSGASVKAAQELARHSTPISNCTT